MRKKMAVAVIILAIIIFYMSPAKIFIKSGMNRMRMDSCGDETEFFTHSPIDFSDFMGIAPLGNLNPSGGHVFPTDHMYFYVIREDLGDWNAIPNEVPVYSPGDVKIHSMHSQYNAWADPPFTDYSIYFSPCRDFEAYFIHVQKLSKKLQKAIDEADGSCEEYSTGGRTYKHCFYDMDLDVSAGEYIGTAGGREGMFALDLGAYDYRKEPFEYANPKRWGRNKDQVVCPLDYFVPDVREKLMARVGDDIERVQRTIEPICGTIYQDVPGTAQGAWFKTGKKYPPEDPHIALVHDNYDPRKAVFSIGRETIKGLESEAYQFVPQDSGFINRDFKDVTPGGVYCYEKTDAGYETNTDIIILLELTHDNKLIIEVQETSECGKGDWTFTKNYEEFER